MGLTVAIVFLGSMAIGIGAVFVGLQRMLLVNRAARWKTASGRIVEARMLTDDEGEKLDIRYEFEVRGHKIDGDTPRLVGDFFIENESRRKYLARFRTGAAVRVYYDPENPGESCLDRSAGGALAMIGGGALFALVSLALLWRYSSAFRFWTGT